MAEYGSDFNAASSNKYWTLLDAGTVDPLFQDSSKNQAEMAFKILFLKENIKTLKDVVTNIVIRVCLLVEKKMYSCCKDSDSQI